MKAILSLFAALLIFSLSNGQSTGKQVDWYIYNTSNSMLPDNSVSTVYVEDNNNIWVGTFSGLAHLNTAKKSWVIYNSYNSEISDNYIKGIAIDQSKVVWATTTSGGLVSLNKGTPTNKGSHNYTATNSGLPSNSLTDIVIDQNDNKWIGTWGEGLVKFDNNTWTVYNSQNSPLPHNAIKDLFIDHNGNIWISAFNSGIAKFNGTSWTIYNTSNSGLPNDNVLSICVDQNNVAWFGTSNSLVRFDGYNWNVYNMSTVGWPFHNVNGICAGQTGYFGTDKGLAIRDTASNWQFKVPNNSGLPSSRVSSVEGASNGYKWIGTYGGGLAVYSESGIALGLDDTKDDFVNIKLYPSPVVSNITVECIIQGMSSFKMFIYNTNGQQIGETIEFADFSGEFKQTIDVSDLPKGYYFIKIQGKDFSIVKKFIKV